ncbi:hypothetical protein KC19_6G042500 [Ceratodon purpureus]|uniref:TF-B3 domain-containing protein n=1 Tax=Ceratodon purpureus TaxID=3225 RepID=A0A8T0HET4_CERPU|nr:hypothetical protein KC19_6G042500 [Ceratodon purpureus]
MLTELEELVLEDLDEAEVTYFSVRIISKTNPARLEVPASFTATTGWPGAVQCSLLTSLRDPKEWPLQMGQLPSSSCVGNAVSDSTGWANFLRHMAVSVGDIIVFEFVDSRCLVASIAYHRGCPPQNVPEEPQVVNVIVPAEPQVVSVNVPELPQVVNVNSPFFKKKLRATHARAHKSARLDIPTAFWRAVGPEKFNGSLITLSGPGGEHVVQSSICVTPKQTFCFFGSGWSDFRALNDFHVGDTIVFTKVTECQYEVIKE